MLRRRTNHDACRHMGEGGGHVTEFDTFYAHAYLRPMADSDSDEATRSLTLRHFRPQMKHTERERHRCNANENTPAAEISGGQTKMAALLISLAPPGAI